MRIVLLCLFALALQLSAFAQQRTYLDADFNPTTKEKASYYRQVMAQPDKTVLVQDFFMNDQLQMEGKYVSREMKTKTGSWTWYHTNGLKAESGSYDKRGSKTGNWKGWHSNGKTEFTGSYKRGTESGTWKWYFENGQLSAEETFTAGSMTDAKYFNQLGVACNDNRCGTVQPAFKGGEQAFFNYLKGNLKYPAESGTKATGQVWVRFKISKTGKIEDAKVTKKISPALDAEALRVVKNMPDWYPGKKHNIPVDTFIEIPLSFK